MDISTYIFSSNIIFQSYICIVFSFCLHNKPLFHFKHIEYYCKNLILVYLRSASIFNQMSHNRLTFRICCIRSHTQPLQFVLMIILFCVLWWERCQVLPWIPSYPLQCIAPGTQWCSLLKIVLISLMRGNNFLSNVLPDKVYITNLRLKCQQLCKGNSWEDVHTKCMNISCL